jgi:hypothetical protein
VTSFTRTSTLLSFFWFQGSVDASYPEETTIMGRMTKQQLRDTTINLQCDAIH